MVYKKCNFYGVTLEPISIKDSNKCMVLLHIYYLPFTKLFNSRAFFSSLIYYNYLLFFLQLSKKEKKNQRKIYKKKL